MQTGNLNSRNYQEIRFFGYFQRAVHSIVIRNSYSVQTTSFRIENQVFRSDD